MSEMLYAEHFQIEELGEYNASGTQVLHINPFTITNVNPLTS